MRANGRAWENAAAAAARALEIAAAAARARGTVAARAHEAAAAAARAREVEAVAACSGGGAGLRGGCGVSQGGCCRPMFWGSEDLGLAVQIQASPSQIVDPVLRRRCSWLLAGRTFLI